MEETTTVRIKIAEDLELEVVASPKGGADYPGASITTYYKGVQVGDVVVEVSGDKLQTLVWDEYAEGDDPGFSHKTPLQSLPSVLEYLNQLDGNND